MLADHETAYHCPTDLAEALALLAAGGLTPAAGCTDLYPATRAQSLRGGVLDLTRIAGLRGIARAGTGWRIGATTTWSDIRAAALPPAFDALKQAAREVGSVQIQNAGTVGGNICNASPAADGVPPLLVLDAQVELASTRGTRVLPLADFLAGPRRTLRAPDEIVTAVLVPDPAGAGVSGFSKLGARRYLVISIAMVAVRLEMTDGRIAAAALSVGACSGRAVRLPAQEAALSGLSVAGAADAIDPALVAPDLSPIDDPRATAQYRAGAAAELLRRTVATLAGGPA